MTKSEEILNNSIYAECYRNGYEQGRADMLMPYDVESIEELIEKVRAKVIEEVKEMATTICKRYEPYTSTDDLRLNARAWGRIDTCHEIIEQLMTDK